MEVEEEEEEEQQQQQNGEHSSCECCQVDIGGGPVVGSGGPDLVHHPSD